MSLTPKTAQRMRHITEELADIQQGHATQAIQSYQKDTLKSLQAEGKSCVTCAHLHQDIIKCAKGRKIYSIHSLCHRYLESSK